MGSHSNSNFTLHDLYYPSPYSQVIIREKTHAPSLNHLNRPKPNKNKKMDKPPLRKYFDQLRFVFFTIFFIYVSLFFLDYYLVVNDHGISFLLVNINAPKQAQIPSSFSVNFSENIGCPNKTSNYSNQNNGTKSDSIVSNAAYGEMNSREHMSPPPVIRGNIDLITKVPTRNFDPCSGQYIYVYDLPRRFNEDLMKRCHSLLKWVDMCPYMTNLGLGPKVLEESKSKVLSNGAWYQTNQFSLEVIFHNTMKHYKCLTKNSSLASAIYVPYYAGLDVGQYLWGFNASKRDASPKALLKWLSHQPDWKRMWGRDHFMVGGRIGYDFRRRTDNDSDWGTKLMFLPEAKNMSILTIESSSYDNEFPIPYPTYFHPSKDNEVIKWQKKMRRVNRPYLFSFAGASRPNSSDSIRSEIIKQCGSSRSCKLLGCYDTNENICDDPVSVISVFQRSVFCLQPPGDSYTRRSTFDSVLAGCIPVFFHPQSAYKQYLWHFPKNYSSYSVYIPEGDVKGNRVLINETLSRVSHCEVLEMREEVIRLIPRIIYGDPSSRLETIEDAFDVAVKGILGRIEEIRREGTRINYSGDDFQSMGNTNSSLAGKKDAK